MIRRCLTPDRDHREGTSPMAADPIAHPAAAGVVELGYRRMRIGAGADDDYGNAAPMEITERFPQPLGNLAQNARFPHSHSRAQVLVLQRENGRTRNVGWRSPSLRLGRSARGGRF